MEVIYEQFEVELAVLRRRNAGHPRREMVHLLLLALPVYDWGGGRGTLFVPEMDEEAFPPLHPEGRLLRFGRRAVRRLVGLRHPR